MSPRSRRLIASGQSTASRTSAAAFHRASCRGRSDFVAWLDQLGARLSPGRPFALAGVSYGGWIAARYAVARRERVSALILIAPAATVVPPRAAFIARALLCLLPLRCFTRSFSRWLSHQLATEMARAARCSSATPIGPIWRSVASSRAARSPPRCSATRTCGGCPSARSSSPARMIACPTRSAAAVRLRRVAPGVRIELIPGAGHDAGDRAGRADRRAPSPAPRFRRPHLG